MKLLINRIGFDLVVILPFISITLFYAIQEHYWAPFTGITIGYVMSWLIPPLWKLHKK
jgi:hypothetical protein